MDSGQNFQCGNNGSSVERNLGQGNDGNEDAEQEVEGTGVAARLEDVGRDLIHDTVAVHQQTDNGRESVQEVLVNGQR